MSQKLVDSVIADLRRTSAMINAEAYEDPTGDISADAYILSEMAEVLDELDWDTIRSHFLKGKHNEDTPTERSTSGICFTPD